MAVDKWRKGDRLTAAQLNEAVDALNALTVMSGDGLIQISQSQAGTAFKLNMAALEARLAKPSPLQPGRASAAWTSGNTVVLSPCVSPTSNTVTGEPDVTAWLISPASGVPDDTCEPVIDAGDVLMYIEIDATTAVVVNAKWRAGGRGGAGTSLAVADWVDVDGVGTQDIVISAEDWRSRVVTYHIAWDEEVLPPDTEWANEEYGMTMIQDDAGPPGTEIDLFDKTSTGARDNVRAYVDCDVAGGANGELRLDVTKGGPSDFMHLVYWIKGAPVQDPTT